MNRHSLFFLLLYLLLKGLAGCHAPAETEAEAPVEAATPPVDPEELRQIYSLAFDSLLGPPNKWMGPSTVIIVDSIIAKLHPKLYPNLYGEDKNTLFKRLEREIVIFSEYNELRQKYPKKWRGIHAYENFDSAAISKIIRNQESLEGQVLSETLPKIHSSFQYVIISSGSLTEESMYGNYPLKVTFSQPTFNIDRDHAIVIGRASAEGESVGKAFFLRKFNNGWEVVGQLQLWVT